MMSHKHPFQHFLSSHSSRIPRYASISMMPSPLTSTRSSKGTTVSPTCKVRNTVVPFEDLVEVSGEGIMDIDAYLGIGEE